MNSKWNITLSHILCFWSFTEQKICQQIFKMLTKYLSTDQYYSSKSQMRFCNIKLLRIINPCKYARDSLQIREILKLLMLKHLVFGMLNREKSRILTYEKIHFTCYMSSSYIKGDVFLSFVRLSVLNSDWLHRVAIST